MTVFIRHSTRCYSLNLTVVLAAEKRRKHRKNQKPQGFTEEKQPEAAKEKTKNRKGRTITMTTTTNATNATNAINTATATEQTFGIELEFAGITREEAAKVLHSYLNSREELCKHMFGYLIIDQQGREWVIDRDPSIIAVYEEQNELVTPVLTKADLPTLRGIVKALKAAGAVSSDELGCGLHCHVSGAGHTAQTLRNLTNIMASHEDQLFKAFGVTKRLRTEYYCQKVDAKFLEKLNKTKPATIAELADIWYNTQVCYLMRDDRYNPSRYHALNLHAFFNPYRYHTVEFRFGQFTKQTSMNWTVLEAFIRICLAMNDLAKNVKTASAKPQADWKSAYSFRCWLLRLGFIGAETKEVRSFLLANFEGDKAWKRAA